MRYWSYLTSSITVALILCLTTASFAVAAKTVIYRCPEGDGFRFGNIRTSAECSPAFTLSEEPSGPDAEALARRYAALYEVDADILMAIAEVESNVDALAISDKGAQGLMQIMPGTQRELQVFDPFNPEESIEAGARYLSKQLKHFGRLDLALAAYNAGPDAVVRHGGIPPYLETMNYVIRVLSVLLERKGVTLPTGSSAK